MPKCIEIGHKYYHSEVLKRFKFLCAFKRNLICIIMLLLPPGDTSWSSPAEFGGWLAVSQPRLQKKMLFL